MKVLRNLIVFGVLFFAIGCAAGQTFISLSSYNIQGGKSSNKPIVVASVIDARQNKDVIATITDADGSVNEIVILNTDIADYFKNSLVGELNSRGVFDGNENAIIANIIITELNANMSGYSSDNMKADIKLILKARIGNEEIVKNFTDHQTKFELIQTASAFSPMIKSMIDEMIVRVANGLSKL